MWPLNKNLLQQTISEEFVIYLLGTICISCTLLYTAIVKNLKIKDNSQVTNALSTLVETSEAIRLLNKKSIHNLNSSNKHASYPSRDERFKQWLAGLIDGDGCFSLSKKGYASLEITMDIRDERALQAVKNVYGGSIKLRSGVNALRYRLHNKKGLLNLIHDVNGHIINSIRLIQLNYICVKYDITLNYPGKLTIDNGWFSGFFDACGNIQLVPGVVRSGLSDSLEKGDRIIDNNPQLVISVTHKYYNIVTLYKDFFGGKINIISNNRYEWSIELQDQITNFIEYVKIFPLRARRHKKSFLAPVFFELVDLKAHQSFKNTMLNKAWKIFNTKFKREIHTKSNNIQYLDKTSFRKLIVWGSYMGSGIYSGRQSNLILNMYKFTNYQRSVLTGILLSDAWLILVKNGKNPRLGLKQSLDKSSYVWNVFNTLAPFCQSLPNLQFSKINNKTLHSFSFYTRSLPCLNEFFFLFYRNNKKVIPNSREIYQLLTPIALAHFIMGDGQKIDFGLILCTDSFTIQEVVRIINVLILRYSLICGIMQVDIGQFRIYISKKSMDKLRAIVLPYMVDTMLYKLNVNYKNK